MSHLVIAESTAELSRCRRYRYTLRRRFAEGPAVLFVGRNPSTADETADDPTIRRCLGFAKRWGFGTLLMGNLYAWRATDPRDRRKAEHPIAEPERPFWNDLHLALMAHDADQVVAAWGADVGPVVDHAAHVLKVVGPCLALGLTQQGHPRHPLFTPGSAELVDYRGIE